MVSNNFNFLNNEWLSPTGEMNWNLAATTDANAYYVTYVSCLAYSEAFIIRAADFFAADANPKLNKLFSKISKVYVLYIEKLEELKSNPINDGEVNVAEEVVTPELGDIPVSDDTDYDDDIPILER